MRKDLGKTIIMDPLTLSPVLKREVLFVLGAGFPFALKREDFAVTFTSKSAPGYMKRLNVIRVDQINNTITCKFGGAVSGQYKISIRHS